MIEKLEKSNVRLSSPSFIRWKSHLSSKTLVDGSPRTDRLGYWRSLIHHRTKVTKDWGKHWAVRANRGLKEIGDGRWWSPRFFYWLKTKRKFPELFTGEDGLVRHQMVRYLRYSRALTDMLVVSQKRALLLEHNLNAESVVWDVGGYIGEWASDIDRLYHSQVTVFEPVSLFQQKLTHRFHDSSNIQIQPYGLSNSNVTVKMSMDGMGSSQFKAHEDDAWTQLRDIGDVFRESNLEEIDLIKINIEGGEYNLLLRMIELDLLKRFRKIMVQFHDQYHPKRRARKTRQRIIEEILKSHSPVFSYPFV